MELLEKYAQLRKEIESNFESIVKQQALDIFERHSDVVLINWRQAIPAFNDGDPCRFYIEDVRFARTIIDEDSSLDYSITNQDDEEEYILEEYMNLYDWEEGKKIFAQDSDEKLYKAISQFEKFLENFEDLVEAVFGSNSQITITRNNIYVESYYCD